MATTSRRMIELLTLLQARTAWTGDALAARLGVSPRTLRRDVGSLRELGYAIDVGLGPGGGYSLGTGTSLPPLILDDRQAVAIAVALQTAPNSVLGLDEAATSALANLRRLIPARLVPQLDALAFTSIRDYWQLMAPPVDTQILLALGRATTAHAVVRLAYEPWPALENENGDGDGLARLRLEPHHLAVWSARWYVVGFEPAAGSWRVLRVDRIRGIADTRVAFAPRELPGNDVTDFIRGQNDRGDAPDHWPCVGELTIGLPASTVARWAPGGAVVRPAGARRCTLTLGAWSWVGLAALAGTFDAEFESVEPAELRAACAVLAGRYARVSSSSP